MALSIRLPVSIEQALDAYCASHGLSKSHVVQECLGEYLVSRNIDVPAGGNSTTISANYTAMKRAGILGSVRGDPQSATKEAVRERALAHLKGKS